MPMPWGWLRKVLKNSKCLGWRKMIQSVWLRGPEEHYPQYEKAGYILQEHVRAPLRAAHAGHANLGLTRTRNRLANNLSQKRIAQETISLGMQGHW